MFGKTKKILWNKSLRQVFIVSACVYLVILTAQTTHLIDDMEYRAYDLRMKFIRSGSTMPEDIVLIMIDEASLAAMEPIAGRWPWKRDVHAGIIDFLALSGAKAVVFDVLFSESTSGSLSDISEQDLRLAQATRDAGNVVHACQLVRDAAFWHLDSQPNTMPALNFLKQIQGNKQNSWPLEEFNTAYWPYPLLAKAANGIGVASFSPDADGTYRRAELLFNHKATLLPAISIVPIVCESEKIELRLVDQRLMIKTPSGETAIAFDRQGYFPVNLYGHYSAYSYSGVYLTLMRLLNGETGDLPVRPREFKDKIVFIGASAAGVEDLKNTSLGYRTPGVLLHASVYSNIMTHDFLRYIPLYLDSGLILLAIIATATGLFFSQTIKKQLIFSFGVLGLFTGMNLVLFSANWIATLVPSIIGILLTYVTSFTWISFASGKEKRKIKTVLGQYVSPAILSTVLADHKDAFISAEVGQRETLSMLFSDIRGFTTIAERYSVEQVVALLNRYLAVMVDVIFAYQGTLDKFIGDAVMAFWGAPVRDADHAFKATASAIDMQKALENFNLENRQRQLPELKMGIGIHTGEVILGNIGSQKKLDYTVIGDGVNLTSRLEGLSKFYGCPILISQDTYEKVKNRICCRIVDYVRVKGKDQCLFIYEPLNQNDTIHPDDEQIAARTQQGFEHYSSRRFEEASACYQQLLTIRPADALSRLFIDRCTLYGLNPPDKGWAGVCVFNSK